MSLNITHSPPTVVSARNPVGFRLAADPNWAAFDDYYILAVIEWEPVYRSGTFEELVTVRGTPDEDGVIEFDFYSRLESLVEADQPNPNLVGGAICERLQKRWKVSFEEFQDFVGQGSFTDGTRYVNKSAFKFRSYRAIWDWILTDKKALTHAPRSREITINFPGWMYFCVSASTASVNLKSEITYDDNTTETVTLFSLSGVAQWDVVYFPVGYQQTGMHTKAKQVKAYEIWLETSGGTEISDHHIYNLRRKCTSLDRYYVFENSLGGFDTVHSRGIAETNNAVQGDQAKRYVGAFFSGYDRKSVQYNTETFHAVEQTIGLIKRDELIWLRDLLKSEFAFRIGDIFPRLEHSTELVPIEIQRDTTKLVEDNIFLSETKFKYTDEAGPGI